MLRFARNDGNFRNDGILDGILNEIAPSALLPRNDAWNSRIPDRDPPVKLGDDIVENFNGIHGILTEF
ncbi:MAG: hypothetical protein SOW03_08185 [Campylobacter sp.]|nr:hypothetical protein [Campylobacteraceae bacterium]MDY2636293.1 hypothetical protein [Campylobacter sp.]